MLNKFFSLIIKLIRWTLFIIGIAIFLWLVFGKYTEWQDLASKIKNESDYYSVQLKAQQESFKTIAQALAGMVVLIGLGFTGWNTRIAQKNMKIAEDGKITDRFSKAVEQLGNDKLEIRLGGIYALERIAIDSEKDHQQVMEVLTAFVRDKSSRRENENHEPASQLILPVGNWHTPTSKRKLPCTDIQAILTIIGRRNSAHIKREKWKIDLSRTYLSDAYLIRANLEKVNFERATLKRAQLCYANLKGARFIFANLEKADLFEANLEKAALVMTNFERASLANTNLKKAILTNANLKGAGLEEANLKGALFLDANLEGANLEGAKNLELIRK
jgi:hypothetical protein